MNFGHSHAELSISVDLEQGDPAVDLRDGLGEQLLKIGLAGMRRCFTRQQGPRGERWAELAGATIEQRRRQGRRGSQIGLVTGGMAGGLDDAEGDYQVDRDRAVWVYTREPRGKALAFNGGNPERFQPPRPFIGWDREAEAQARRLLAGDDVGGLGREGSGLFDY